MLQAIQTDIEEYLGPVPQKATGPITVECKAFAQAMTRASGAIGRSATIPILNCVLLRIANGILTIEATN